jgi:signal transduction histidine kinase
MITDRKKYNILVIEDNTGDFVLIEEFLLEQFEDINLLYAKNYKAAVEILNENNSQFDVVLLDLSLPDKTGVSLISEIIKICADTPVIVLTGYDDFDFGVKSLSLGISDYLLKEELTPLTLYKSIIYSYERKKIIAALEASEKRARSFAKQLNNALEDERSRIAREIHDELGQQFSGLKMSLSSLKKLNGPESAREEIIDTMIGEVNVSIQSLRQIANELRPVIIDKLGLFAAIEWLVSGFERKTGIACETYITVQQIVFDKIQEINIFRICQEAITNITRHAQATKVSILIDKIGSELIIKITDNGIGIAGGVKNSLSMGLLNMNERANFIGAKLDIASSPNNGTIIELILSINGEKNINSRRSLSN